MIETAFCGGRGKDRRFSLPKGLRVGPSFLLFFFFLVVRLSGTSCASQDFLRFSRGAGIFSFSMSTGIPLWFLCCNWVGGWSFFFFSGRRSGSGGLWVSGFTFFDGDARRLHFSLLRIPVAFFWFCPVPCLSLFGPVLLLLVAARFFSFFRLEFSRFRFGGVSWCLDGMSFFSFAPSSTNVCGPFFDPIRRCVFRFPQGRFFSG